MGRSAHQLISKFRFLHLMLVLLLNHFHDGKLWDFLGVMGSHFNVIFELFLQLLVAFFRKVFWLLFGPVVQVDSVGLRCPEIESEVRCDQFFTFFCYWSLRLFLSQFARYLIGGCLALKH